MLVTYFGDVVGLHVYTTLDQWYGVRDLNSGTTHEYPATLCTLDEDTLTLPSCNVALTIEQGR